MKLDTIDKKLLTYLYHNYRSPLTKIGKECRISRDQVEYRLEKFEKSGLIKKYLTVFNYALLGFNDLFIVYMKTKNKEKVKLSLQAIKNTLSVGDVVSSFDIFVNFICENKNEFDSIFSSFLEKHKEEIQSYEIFNTTYAEFFPLKAFGNQKNEISYKAVEPKQKIDLDKKEIDILKELEKNGRSKIIDIASKIGISGELALYKLKQLRKKEVILGNRIQFDMQKLGFYFSILRLKVKNLDQILKEKIRHFCKTKKYTNALIFSISDYNVLIQLFYQNEDELRKAINELNEEFREYITQDSLILIENEMTARTIPF
ncbi:MAG: Lrp/AsnC family transcriptional regulator [Candidatus Woesearchaeota archaeon]|nr:Lrp/AsnC family transcriptional regulator [Candidatus Woesearchaeota archaeon]